MGTMIAPVLALVVVSLVVWAMMVATRLPAMAKAKLPPQAGRYTNELTTLPAPARDIADNYNHLMEQPTIFYATALAVQVAGDATPLNVGLAWGYVGLRIVHSIIQCTSNNVVIRFYLFLPSTLVLGVLAGSEIVTLVTAGA